MRVMVLLEIIRTCVLPWINAVSLAMIARELCRMRRERE